MFRTLGAFAGISALAASTALAQPDLTPPLPTLTDEQLLAASEKEAEGAEVIEVTSDAPAESASSVHLSASELRYRSRTQPSDLLRQVPGLVVSQHAGGGKSDQYFLRGFDADHGTDIAIYADGIPVNLTSHGHGQGYADTHWLIPETLESVDMHKGPYAARYGDFYTAGALELKTIDKIDGPTMWIAAGSPLTGQGGINRRLVGMASPSIRSNKDDKSLIAAQIGETDGPFVNPQDFRHGNALVKWQGDVGPGSLKLEGNWYQGTWNQSGQLPDSEIAAGRVSRFGAIDPSEGGKATRASGQVGYTVRDTQAGTAWKSNAYVVGNKLDLFSNFTLYARDQVNGDEIEQTDGRLLYGADTAYEKRIGSGDLQALLTVGAQLRADDVETSLWHASQRRRLDECFAEGANPCNHTDNHIKNLGAYAEAKIMKGDWLRVYPGLRVDGFSWNVSDLDPETANDPMTTTGGSATKAIVSPKLSVEIASSDTVALFANTGMGFHSNDARAAVASKGNGALARAIGGEFGARMKPSARARVSADVWYLHLASEQVWSGDAGGTEASDPTRRFGLDIEGSVDATDWLSLDANVTWAHATAVANAGNGGALALAPRWMGSGGFSVHDKRGFVSVRARGIGDRSGNDDGTLTAEGYMIYDIIAGKKLGKSIDLNLTVNNVLNANWREAQFAEESRVSPTAGLMEQMHYTPGTPLTATLTAAYTY